MEATHDASGSTIRANSRRLATLLPGAARDEAKRDVEADIERYVEVGIENQAACVVSLCAVEVAVCARLWLVKRRVRMTRSAKKKRTPAPKLGIT